MNGLENKDLEQQGYFDIALEIATNYSSGELIPHEWLKSKFGLASLDIADYESQDEFIKAINDQQFTYMNSVERLRCQLLNKLQVCLRNVWGEGYEIIPPEDQTRYGYDGFIKNINKAIREAKAIMNNVASVSAEQQAKDNDLRAKFAMLAQMIKSAK